MFRDLFLCPREDTAGRATGERFWNAEQADDGTGRIVWVTPTGHKYETEPETSIASAISAELRKKVLPEDPPF